MNPTPNRSSATLFVTLFCWLIVFSQSASSTTQAAEPPWTGQGTFRILTKIPPIDIGSRPHDQRPAELEIDVLTPLSLSISQPKRTQSIDVTSFQIVRYNPKTGQPIPNSGYVYGQTPADVPFRWLDAAIPYQFPEFLGNVSRTAGKLPRKPNIRGGYFYDPIGDWKKGRLTWLHTQEANKPSHYAIYFNLLPTNQKPNQVPPRNWIGDGLPRCDLQANTTISSDHCRIDVDDWNDDGLIDIISGEQYGHVFVWPNTGTKEKPQFPFCNYVSDENDIPIDVGAGSTPKVVDWNNDGHKDLLLGAEWNRTLLFLNQGTNANRRLKYMGQLKADGDVLKLPIRPLTRGSEDIFKRDYYPILETVDWDNDGDLDLLAGGYVTGMVFFYENVRTGDDGLPELKLSGPIEADGKPLNVTHWCAAPTIADFDHDGDLDLISGNMPMGKTGGDKPGTDSFLKYYENVGTRDKPQLSERPFPATGNFPRSRLATPRATDWNKDGSLDLIVSARQDIYLFENDGPPSKPHFMAHSTPIKNPWGNRRIPADQFLDWNGDGKLDLFTRGHYSIRLNSGKGNPWSWDEAVPILPAGQHIAHPSGIGDDWYWPFLNDFDQDGKFDILFGDWSGHIWFHKNQSTGETKQFDMQGHRLKLTNGELLKVGPIGGDINKDFGVLQGARTTFTVADFDRDGLPDLVVGDTYGKVRYFRQHKVDGEVAFESPVLIGELGIRLLIDATDWNGDGWPDVVAGAANGRVRVILNSGKENKTARFEEGFDPQIPPIAQPRILMADLNGDGDDDLYLPSTQGSCFIERSFLQHGYAKGQTLAIETNR